MLRHLVRAAVEGGEGAATDGVDPAPPLPEAVLYPAAVTTGELFGEPRPRATKGGGGDQWNGRVVPQFWMTNGY